MKQIFQSKVLLFLTLMSMACREGHSKDSVGSVVGGHADKEIETLFQDYFEWKWRLVPQAASSKGLFDLLNGDEINDMSLNFVQKIPLQCHQYHKKAKQILEKYQVVPQTKYFLNFLKYETNLCVKGFQHKGFLMPPVSFMNGVHITLSTFFKTDNEMKLESLDDYKSAVKRLEKVPQQIDQVMYLLNKGVEAGKTYANESIFRTKLQFKRLDVRAEASDFYQQFKQMPEKLALKTETESKEVELIQSQARSVIEMNVLPAIKKLENYLHGSYSKHLRSKSGVFSITNGQEYYQACLEYHTTLTDISPEEIHNIGLNEVESLREKMLQVAVELGFPTDITFSNFITAMQDDPKQFFASEDEILNHFNSLLHQINPLLNKTFQTDDLQEMENLEVKGFPAGRGGLAFYNGPTIDGRRNGTFYVNLENVEALKQFELMALTLHEGNPGHHLQQTQLINNPYLPFFIKLPADLWGAPSSFPEYTAFTEGWALYAEYLGHELGLYNDPIDRMSYLSWNLLRASRLVVDTGIHAFDWSRQKAIDYLLSNTGLSRYSCEAQIDRYISLPGQATAYKIGERKIRELRKSQMETLGENFDVKKFHSKLLNCVGPLELLEECVNMESMSESQSKRYYGRVPKISRKSKNLHSSSNSITRMQCLHIVFTSLLIVTMINF